MQRRWGRRDNQAIAAAQQAVEAAVVKATEHDGDCRRWLSRAVDGQRQRSAAMADAEPQMEALIEAVGELDAGLDDTRTARVVAMVTDAHPPDHLVVVLGKPPAHAAGRQVWCALASGIESYRDRHPEALGHGEAGIIAAIGPRPGERFMPSPEWDGLAGQLRRGPALMAMAARLDGPAGQAELDDQADWLASLDAASAAVEAQRRFVERGLSRDRGMDIGW